MTLLELNILFQEAKYEELIAQVEQSTEVAEEMKQQLALSYYHTENYEKSTKLFSEICEKGSDAVAWFNLCTSAIMNDDEHKGLDALNKAMRLNRETETNGEGITTPFMQLYATKAFVDTKKYNLAFNQLNELAEVYGSLSVTNYQFLYEKGVPAFDEFVKLGKAILPKQTVTDAKDWVAYTSSRLDEEGKMEMQNILKC